MLKTKKKAFHHLLIPASIPEILAFKVSKIMGKNAKRKLSILCPFSKNCDVTTRICVYSIFKSPVIQTLLKYSFNYLTGKQFKTIVVKSCSSSDNAYQ